MRQISILLAGLLALLACEREDTPAPTASAGAVVHPDARYLVREVEPAGTFRISSPIEPAGLRGLRAALPDSSAVAFGRLEGAEYEVLAGVDGFAVDRAGRAYILDAANSVVRVVDRAGAYVTSAGRAGKGPGDFFRPQSIAIDPAGRLLVGDMLRRVQRFEWRDGKLELDTVLALTASPEAICATDSLIVVHGTNENEGALLQIYDENGIAQRSFGAAYRSNLAVLNILAGRGRLLCRADRDEIVLASRGFVPDVRVFGFDGRTKKLLVAEDLQVSRVEEFPDGSYTARIDSGSHTLLSLLPVGERRMLLQYGLITREARAEGREYAAISSVLLDLETNTALARDSTLPHLAAWTERGAVAIVDSEFPQVRWRR